MIWAFGHAVAAIGAATMIPGGAGIILATFIVVFYLMIGIWADAFSMWGNSGEEDEEHKYWWETRDQAQERNDLNELNGRKKRRK
jgi:hypothetical protein